MNCQANSELARLTLWQELRISPDTPSHTRIYKSVLVSRHVDRDDLLQSEIPNEIWIDEWRYKSSRSSINVDRAVNVALNKQVVDGFGILVLAGECSSQNGANP